MKYIYVCLMLFFIFYENIVGQNNKLYETPIYLDRVQEFKNKPIMQNEIVFLGNSLIQNGKWEELFDNVIISNRGIIGNNTEGMLTLLPEIVRACPRKLFFIGGINDISQDKSNIEILQNISTLIAIMRKECPNTSIYIHSILPINNTFGKYTRLLGKEEQIIELNKSLKELCDNEGVAFINLYPHFLDKTRKLLNANLTRDGLHLNDDGYKIWATIDKPYVNE